MNLNCIYNCDNVVGLRGLPDGCIDLTVTSPPYDNLRAYNGFAWDAEGLIAELYRVTKPGGVVVWIVADATIKGSETGSSFRQALAFIAAGFNLHDTMVYLKSSQPRQKTRYEQQFEYMFVLSKGRPKTFNPIKIKCKNAGRKTQRRCRDHGTDDLVRSNNIVADYKIKENVWFYPPNKNSTGHPAVFPEQLATDHIISWSNPGDVVLDPFMGSGTTAVACIRTGRKYIGFELDEKYCSIARQRVSQEVTEMEAKTNEP